MMAHMVDDERMPIGPSGRGMRWCALNPWRYPNGGSSSKLQFLRLYKKCCSRLHQSVRAASLIAMPALRWRKKAGGVFLNVRKDLISSDINAYIANQAAKDAPFITCGSVDDGKSTSWRLLYESDDFDDQLSRKRLSKFGTEEKLILRF